MATIETWHFSRDLGAFLDHTETFLRSQPTLHTVLLTVTNALRQAGPMAPGPGAPLFGTLAQDGHTLAAFVYTQQHGLVVSPLSEPAAAALAARLADEGETPHSFSGDRESVEAIVNAWRQCTGDAVVQHRRERLYSLDTLTAPARMPAGRAQVADQADRSLLMRWAQEYATAIGEPDGRDFGNWADTRLAYGGVTLWENDEGEPAAMAGCSPLIAGQVRIAPVYTPIHLRGHGYGSAVTAAVAQAALVGGADNVLLFTDLANATSNALYQRLGFRPITDFVSYRRYGRGSVTAN
ncbi:GNAT family N-acetyltransferase [Streptomyces sp. TG1A-8]|uniref:GNAT family N-acetyltransferase n=1 Tax=Streptomyces sp. TG1A-8 TaxID=3051385 RepID=UPI00265C06F8|nr:GNAT family N-acetyltransferase [Streptomyces sp. TG1A-8]MDO0929771.1 GNAT family N-acetyltransferase [Streptomyces sp. TG1A-8]MDO0930178.1 GNAT family N-acetyltransferase [Streptomyces sp. TG1A-8]